MTVVSAKRAADAGAVVARVTVAVYGPGDTIVFQHAFENREFRPGEEQTYALIWEVPAAATAGPHTVQVGVVAADDGTPYAWNNRAARFTVTSAPTAAPPTATTPTTPTPTTPPTATPTHAPTATPTAAASPTATPAPVLVEAAVNRVIDGDSLDAQLLGNRTAVGYLGADAPPSNQPCGPEALARNRELAGARVLLEEDPAYRVDALGRRLYYAYTPEGLFIDAVLVREGLAGAARLDARYGASLAALEADARAAGRGCLWSGAAGA